MRKSGRIKSGGADGAKRCTERMSGGWMWTERRSGCGRSGGANGHGREADVDGTEERIDTEGERVGTERMSGSARSVIAEGHGSEERTDTE